VYKTLPKIDFFTSNFTLLGPFSRIWGHFWMGGREWAKLPSGGRIRAMANEKLAHIKKFEGSAEGSDRESLD